ncbi:radical SAM protein [Desulfuromonas carbonis]|uniref:B12-binding domain-containing radical SAM protein n=1 Tax=Desulfuromonas sp. DDH964 TaxID=1823759 RepID=UPI00078EB4D4|nr:radical SAM protein [Desulfuromonas sp. DDH964]AMV73310.1 radical SAM domain-containing iron-sulfur cluster-binding oxidoreductase [Desulfuromonas sp. DDH964]
MDILLLHPPAAKPAEPPLATAILLGHLRSAGITAAAIDANLDACLWLLTPERLALAAGAAPATALRRAIAHLPRALALLRSPRAGDSLARYRSAVEDLNRALGAAGGAEERLSLGDYVHQRLSPFRPADLERLAAGAESTLFRAYFEQELLPRVLALQPRIIAVTINYRHQALPAFELAGLLRRALPQVQLVAGGGLISSWAQPLRQRGQGLFPFDHLVTGPGEASLVALAGNPAGAPLPTPAPVNHFVPDYSFADPAAYLAPEPVLQLTASRGCYWARCRFCPEATTPTQPYRAFPPGEVPKLLVQLAAAYRVRRFHFTDNALPPATLRALAAAAEPLAGLSWHGFARFEGVLDDPDLVAGLARAGCRMLQLGLESGAQPVLERLHKGTDLAVASRILHHLHAAGIATYVYILLGTPEETAAEAESTLVFLEEHADCIDFLNLAIMNLPRAADFGGEFPGAEWQEEPLGLYRPLSDGGWGRAAARRFLAKRLLAAPAIRAIAARTPPWFTSNHAPFFIGAGRH